MISHSIILMYYSVNNNPFLIFLRPHIPAGRWVVGENGMRDNVVIPQKDDDSDDDKSDMLSPLLRAFCIKHFVSETQPPYFMDMCANIRWSVRVLVTCCAGVLPVCSQSHFLSSLALIYITRRYVSGFLADSFNATKFSPWNILEVIERWVGVAWVSLLPPQ